MQLARTREQEREMKNTRLVMWEIRTKYLKKGKRIAPKDIFMLPGDKEEIKIISKEDYQKLNKMWGN
jgi:hypothetical protein